MLLAITRVQTFSGDLSLSGASGFFFERGTDLYLVTSRHVLCDAKAAHFPSRISIELHLDEANLTRATGFSIPLYEGGSPVWRQASDAGGSVDIAVIRLDRDALTGCALRAFTPAHIGTAQTRVPVGSALTIVGFPLGFHDALHRLPVARQAALASSFGLHFQGQGFFITDARTHRGSSGAPVLLAVAGDALPNELQWKLLGVHSSRMDMSDRDRVQDESLGLNCAWYADVLMELTRGARGEIAVPAPEPAEDDAAAARLDPA